MHDQIDPVDLHQSSTAITRDPIINRWFKVCSQLGAGDRRRKAGRGGRLEGDDVIRPRASASKRRPSTKAGYAHR